MSRLFLFRINKLELQLRDIAYGTKAVRLEAPSHFEVGHTRSTYTAHTQHIHSTYTAHMQHTRSTYTAHTQHIHST